MKWTALLTLVLIGLVAGDGAWEVNRVYRYKLQSRTFLPLRESDNNYVGVISRAYLTIRPQSENLLIGQISQAEYGEVNQQLSDVLNSELNDRQVAYDQWPLNELFKIHLENGAIRSLSVERSMSDYKINQLKVIVSQLQVDTNAQYQIKHNENRLAEGDDNNAFYKTMEPIVTGKCETLYDISPLPDYLVEAHSEWVPKPELKEDGEYIQIIKTRNYNNCDSRRSYFFDIIGTKQIEENVLSSSENKRYNTDRVVSKNSRQIEVDDSSAYDSRRTMTGRVRLNQMEEDDSSIIGNRRTMTAGLKQNSNQIEEDDSSVQGSRRMNGREWLKPYRNEMEIGNRRTTTGRVGLREYTDEIEKMESFAFGNRRTMTGRPRQNTNLMEENDMYRRYITGRDGLRQYINDLPKDLSLSENRRIIISGSLKKYTIQSSVTTSKVVNSRSNYNNLALYDYVSTTLESVTQSYNNDYPALRNLMDIGNLVYTYDSDHKAMPMKNTYRTQQYGDLEEYWSKCWTWFPSSSTICKSEFGPEFEDVGRKACGFLGMGMQTKCRRSFPGCKDTPCFSYFIPKSQMCERTFGTDFPFTKGGFQDCLPGFYRSRCCPKSDV